MSDHRHEFEIITLTDYRCYARCMVVGCDKELTQDEINARLYACEALSAEDALQIAADVWQNAEDKLYEFARILKGKA